MTQETDENGTWENVPEQNCKVRYLVAPSAKYLADKAAIDAAVPPEKPDGFAKLIAALKKNGALSDADATAISAVG